MTLTIHRNRKAPLDFAIAELLLSKYMASVAPLSISHQQQLAKIASLLEEAGRLMRQLNVGPMRFTPVSSVKRPDNVPKDQEWFWTDEWQQGEQEVDEALARGEYKEFNSMEEMIADLHAHV